MCEFSSIYKRLLNADYSEYNSILKMFLDMINREKIIADYVNLCCEEYLFDCAEDIRQLKNNLSHSTPNFGESVEMETAHIYQFLTYIVEHDVSVPEIAFMRYSTSKKINDSIKGFNDQVVMIFIQNIKKYLVKIGIEMGVGESTVYNVSVTNDKGQTIVIVGSSNVHASQTNGVNLQELQNLLQSVREQTPATISDEDSETLTDSLEVIESELGSEHPKKSMLKTATKALKDLNEKITNYGEFSAALGKLLSFVSTFIQ